MDKRQEMIDVIKHRYGLKSPKVLSAIYKVPRDAFVEKEFKSMAFEDQPIPIGFSQTVSQPYTVAFMTHLLDLKGKEKVLEIGTGSGYQAAILSKLAKEVYTIEIIKGLAKKAKEKLRNLGYKNVFVKHGKGEKGWKKHAPYDAIIITAGVKGEVPKILFNQLKVGGKLVAPVGRGSDKIMIKYQKLDKDKIEREKHGIFHFVPFIS